MKACEYVLTVNLQKGIIPDLVMLMVDVSFVITMPAVPSVNMGFDGN